jgi:hypothetical protein
VITIRAYRPETDEAFVYDSWLKSRRDDVERDPANVEHYVPRDVWRDAQRRVIGLALQTAHVRVAEAEGVILGWCCAPLWAYVKQAYRGRGIYKRLRDEQPQSEEGRNGT